MNRPEALQQLANDNQRVRLSAARVLASSATPEDIPDLKRALRSEAIPWVRSALEAGIARALASPQPEGTQPDLGQLTSDDALASEVYARAIEELTDRFVHEFRPLVGLARVQAQREIEDFDSSETAIVLGRMQVLLRAIDTLGRAAAAPKLRLVNLASLVNEASESCTSELRAAGHHTPSPAAEGPPTLEVLTDPDLLTLAIRNGVKNALEASLAKAERVVISWGQSSQEYWISVLDFGSGLPTEGRALFTIGTSTKVGHFGMGLAIVERVVSTLGGLATLDSLSTGATQFELRIARADQT